MSKRLKWILAATAAVACIQVSANAAQILSLGIDGSTATSGTIGGATFALTALQPTGTGVIDPFLRVQASSHPIEQGYNTDNPGSGSSATMDDLAGIYTHSIQLGNVGTVLINGVANYQFLLDANQTGSQPSITLDKFQLFLSSAPKAPNLTLAGLGTPVFNIDGGGVGSDRQVNLVVQNTGGNDPFGNHGSGSGDLYVYVPVSEVGGSATDFLTLYAEFGGGNAPNYENNDGFEEWAVVNTQQVADASGTLMLLGIGLMGLEGLRRKIRA